MSVKSIVPLELLYKLSLLLFHHIPSFEKWFCKLSRSSELGKKFNTTSFSLWEVIILIGVYYVPIIWFLATPESSKRKSSLLKFAGLGHSFYDIIFTF
jgi:hypothetical protein